MFGRINLSQARLSIILLCLCFILLAILSFVPGAGLHDGDSINHYFISRYSFRYPHLFLDLWGKPLFTLLSAPFSQAGFRGIQLFNVMCACGAAYTAFLLARQLGLRLAPLAILYTIFMPVYLFNIPSGLTELLFSLVLTGSIYLVVTGRNTAGALLVSFLPFARSEGFLILPLFALLFLLHRQYRYLPLLAAGTAVYSIIGGIAFGDLLWVFHRNPYTGAAAIYGHGELLHFVKNSRAITGIPLNIFFAVGLITGFIKLWRWCKFRFSGHRDSAELLLVYGSAVLILTAHSVFWWKGIYGSLGMLRVMASIAPCMAIIALRGTETVVSPLLRYPKTLFTLLALTTGIFTVRYQVHDFLRQSRKGDEKRLLKETASWIKENNLQGRKLFYSHPLTLFFLERDPFDTARTAPLDHARHDMGRASIRAGSIIVWETLLGPREMGIPADSLINPARFTTLKTWHTGKASIGEYDLMVLEKK